MLLIKPFQLEFVKELLLVAFLACFFDDLSLTIEFEYFSYELISHVLAQIMPSSIWFEQGLLIGKEVFKGSVDI